MKRALAVAVVAVAALAGCGTDTCTSNPASLAASLNQSCTLSAGSTATVYVTLCSKCNDSAPTCQAEFRNGVLEVAPVVQQCVDQSGCASTGCNSAASRAACPVAIPTGVTAPTTIYVLGETTQTSTLYIGSGSSCTL